MFSQTDLLFFALTLKDELNVRFNTLKKYIKEAYHAILALGFNVTVTSLKPLFKLVKSSVFHYTVKKQRIGTRAYCSITWKDILL